MKLQGLIIAALVFGGLLLLTSTTITAQYQTYKFLDFDAQVLVDIERRPENVDHLKAAISRELEARGLSQSEDPDLFVNIGVVVKEEIQTRETNARQDMRYLGQRNYTWQVEEVPIGTYNEGTVTIDLVDVEKNQLVWEGKTSSVILKNNNKMQKRIDSGVKKAFKKFDPAKL
jgi:hypothetical protein